MASARGAGREAGSGRMERRVVVVWGPWGCAGSLSPFSVAVTDYLGPRNLLRKGVYVAHCSGGWEVQEHSFDICMPSGGGLVLP